MRKLATNEIGRLSLSAVDSARHPVEIVVENVRSAFNVGSILRTADALALNHVHLTGYTPDGDHRGVHKAALGAQDSVPWRHHAETGALMDSLREQGYTLAALEITDTPTSVTALDLSSYPIALVVGNEVTGVSNETLELCDLALEIPQFGVKHSLNVSVATGVMGYDLVRRWHELNTVNA